MTLCLNHKKGDFAIIMEFKVRDEKEEASLEDTAKEAAQADRAAAIQHSPKIQRNLCRTNQELWVCV